MDLSKSLIALKVALIISLSATLLQGCQEPGSAADLFAAAKANDAEKVRLLIRNGVDPNARRDLDLTNVSGRIFHARDVTALHVAAFYGNLEVSKELIATGADVNARNAAGSTPLQGPAFNDHPDVVKALIEAGTNVDEPNDGGVSPLMNAANGCAVESLRVLLANGANPRKSDPAGMTALHFGELAGLPAMQISTLLTSPVSGIAAARANLQPKRLAVIRILLEHGAPPGAGQVVSPVGLAAMLGDTEALKLMLPKVKNINELSAGITLLALAAHSGNLEAVKLLLKDGAKANVHMPDGTVAFDHAGSQAIRNLLRARPGKPER